MEYMWFWAQRNSSPKTEGKEPMWKIPFWVSQHFWYKPLFLVSESIFLWSKCQVCCWSWLLEWLQCLVQIQCENVSSSYTRLLQCIIHSLLTLPLTSNYITFHPKQTHSVVESGLVKIFSCSSNAWTFLIIDLFPLLLSFQDVFHPYRVKCEIWGMDQFGIESLNQTMFHQILKPAMNLWSPHISATRA